MLRQRNELRRRTRPPISADPRRSVEAAERARVALGAAEERVADEIVAELLRALGP